MLPIDDEAIVRTSLSALSNIPEGGATEVEAEVDGEAQSLILTRRGEYVSAFFNVCPHAGRRLDWAPGRFLIDQGHLVCAAHGATFTLDRGECVSGPCRGQALRSVAVDVEDGRVLLAE
jgi:nitrite reductase/ring-hydroxylating ferredoxin subunit